MASEILMGRAGRQSPINAMRDLVAHSNANPLWQVIGWMGAMAGFMILSFYAVIAGWAISYFFQMGENLFSCNRQPTQPRSCKFIKTSHCLGETMTVFIFNVSQTSLSSPTVVGCGSAVAHLKKMAWVCCEAFQGLCFLDGRPQMGISLFQRLVRCYLSKSLKRNVHNNK